MNLDLFWVNPVSNILVQLPVISLVVLWFFRTTKELDYRTRKLRAARFFVRSLILSLIYIIYLVFTKRKSKFELIGVDGMIGADFSIFSFLLLILIPASACLLIVRHSDPQ